VSGGLANYAGVANNYASGTIQNGVSNYAAFNNWGGVSGGLTNYKGVSNNAGTIQNAVVNYATFNNAGSVTGGLYNLAGVSNLSAGSVDTVWNGGGTVNNGASITNGVTNYATFNNQGGSVTGTLTNVAGTSNNYQGTVTQAFVLGGTFNNYATVTGNVVNYASFNQQSGSVGGTLANVLGTSNIYGGTVNQAVVYGGTVNNYATIQNGAANYATFNNYSSGVVKGGLFNDGSGVANNYGAIQNGVANYATFNNSGTVQSGGLVNYGTAVNAASGAINGGVTNGGRLTTLGTISGGLNNIGGGIVDATGTINGNVLNDTSAGGSFNVNGTLTENGAFTNASGNSALNVGLNKPSNLSVTSLTNGGAINIANGSTLAVASNLTNTGGIYMNAAGDYASKITVGGNYIGGGTLTINSQINGTASNQLIVNGTATGTTYVNIVQDTSSLTAARGPNAIVTFTTAGSATTPFIVTNGYTPAGEPDPTGMSNGRVIASTGILQEWAGYETNAKNSSQTQLVTVVAPNTTALTNMVGAVSGILSNMNSLFSEPASAFITAPANPDPNTLKFGVWSRARTGDFTTSSASTVTVNVPGLSPQTASNQANSSVNGIQLGGDAGLYNIQNSGWNANFGAHGGYIGGIASAPGVNIHLQESFYGVYGALTKGAFAFDVLLRRDIYGLNLTAVDPYAGNLIAPGGNNISGQGWSGIVNTQYRYALTESGWFLEPSASFLFSTANINPLSVVLATNSYTAVHFNQFDSAMGRLGVRVGTTLQPWEAIYVVPYTSLSVWREFAGNSLASLDVGTVGSPIPVTISTTRVGTFGQASLGVAVASPVQNITGFVRGDLRFGDQINGTAINGGLRYQF
jgi:hypothetical protein